MITDYKDEFDVTIGKRFVVDAVGTEYFIAGDGVKIVHYGEIDEKHEVVTGQKNLDTYKDKATWINELKKLGITPDKEDTEIGTEVLGS